MTPIEYNFAIYMHFFKYTMKVFIFSFHQVILGFVMEEALFFMTLPLHCNIFLIHVPFPFETIFLPNSHEFSKANCDTSGFLLSFSWYLCLAAALRPSADLQRQAEMLSSLFVVRKLNGKLITVPHSAFKYKQLCICVCKYKLWNQLATSESLLSLQAVEDAKTWNQKIPAVTCPYLQIIRWHSSLWLSTESRRAEYAAWCWSSHCFKNTRIQN